MGITFSRGTAGQYGGGRSGPGRPAAFPAARRARPFPEVCPAIRRGKEGRSGRPASARRSLPGLGRAFLALAAAALASGSGGAQEPVTRPVVLRAPHVHVRIDPQDPRLDLYDEEGARRASLPLGLRIRPVADGDGWLRPSPEIVVPLQERKRPREEPEGDIEADTVLVGLVDAEGRTRATCAVRAVAWGAHVVFDLPQSAFVGVVAPADVTLVRRSGEPLFAPLGGLALGPGDRIEFDVRSLGLSAPLEHHRLRLAVRGAGALAVRLDGRGLGLAPAGRDGGTNRADIALVPGGRLVLSAEGEVTIEEAALLASGGVGLSLLERVRLSREGIDLFESEGTPPPLRPGGSPPPPVVGVRSTGLPFAPPPFAVSAESDAARFVVALDRLPPALRFGFESGHLVVDLPTRAMSSAPPNPALERTLTLGLGVFLAGDPDETGSRLRTRLLTAGGAPWIEEERIVDPPPAARLPALFLDASARGMDARRAEFLVEGAALRLGCERFAVVVGGGWMRAPGDPFPSERFGDPRPFVMAQHVAGRPVLFEWPLVEAAPGSAAETIGAAEGGLVTARSLSRARRYYHEVARYVVGEGLDLLGADGLLLTGLDRVAPPPAGRWPETGGARDLRVLLDMFARDARATAAGREIALAAPSLLPQTLRAQDIVLCDPWALADEERERWLRFATSLAPDATLLFAPPPGDPEPITLARLSVAGRPALRLDQVMRLDEDTARRIGAVFRFSAERPPGVASFDAEGRSWTLRVGDTLRASELEGGRALLLVDGPDRARVFAIGEGPIALPFPARVDPPLAGVRVEGDPPALVGLRPGEVAALRR